jgi:hypothetical protein
MEARRDFAAGFRRFSGTIPRERDVPRADSSLQGATDASSLVASLGRDNRFSDQPHPP